MHPRPRGLRYGQLALGVAGWALLAAVVIGERRAVLPAAHVDAMAFGWFVAVIALVRALAIRLDDVVLSLDVALYVAAAFVLGPARAAVMVACVLLLDSLLRDAVARRQRVAHTQTVSYGFYYGGQSGALLWLVCQVWSVGQGPHGDQVALCLRYGGTAITFLALHYLMGLVRTWASGAPLSTYLRRTVVRTALAEALVVPIAMALVLLYDGGQRVGFVLLSITYVILHAVFTRMHGARLALAAHLRELEVLHQTGRALSGTIELERLVETVARATCVALPAAREVRLVHRGGSRDPDRLVVDAYERAGERFTRDEMRRGAGLVAEVMQGGAPRRVDDLRALGEIGAAAGGAHLRAWVGVPIRLGDVVEGALVVGSDRPAAFVAADERLLESIGDQFGAALRNAYLYEMAMVDGLTGLFVRRYFDARLDEELARAARFQTPFAVVMIDIDDFKQLNDEHGHLLGDRVLRDVASTVRGQMRGVDTAARYGGEELALILPRCDSTAAARQAERLREALASLRIAISPDEGAPRIGVTASFGVAAVPDHPARTPADLVRVADAALYRAKRLGKNRVEVAVAGATDPERPAVTPGPGQA